MNTIANRKAFNARTQKSRISAGWDHDGRHYRFQRIHPSSAPFAQPRSADRLADAIVGVVALVALLFVLMFMGGQW